MLMLIKKYKKELVAMGVLLVILLFVSISYNCTGNVEPKTLSKQTPTVIPTATHIPTVTVTPTAIPKRACLGATLADWSAYYNEEPKHIDGEGYRFQQNSIYAHFTKKAYWIAITYLYRPEGQPDEDQIFKDAKALLPSDAKFIKRVTPEEGTTHYLYNSEELKRKGVYEKTGNAMIIISYTQASIKYSHMNTIVKEGHDIKSKG